MGRLRTALDVALGLTGLALAFGYWLGFLSLAPEGLAMAVGMVALVMPSFRTRGVPVPAPDAITEPINVGAP